MLKNNITPLERLQLGGSLCEGLPYGEVTNLASDYKVSRWFLYDCKKLVKSIITQHFSTSKPNTSSDSAIYTLSKRITSLYLNCHSSLQGICACLEDLFDCSRVRGFISGLLNEIGACLPIIDSLPTLKGCKDIQIRALSDEMYINGLPILGVVDASSNYLLGLLLSEDCDADSWGYFWLSLTDNDTSLLADIGCDLGSGLQKSLKEYVSSADFHYDLFHYLRPLAQIRGNLSRKIEKKWKELVRREAQLKKHLESTALKVARSCAEHNVKQKKQVEKLNAKTKQYQEALVSMYQELEKWMNREVAIQDLMHATQCCLEIVDKEGVLRTDAKVKEDLLFYLDYGIAIIDYKPLTEALTKLKKHHEGAIKYFEQLPKVQTQLQKNIPQEDIRTILLIIWRLDQAIRSTKNYKHKKRKKKQQQSWKQLLIEQIGKQQYDSLYQSVRTTMQTIIRSSSMMENLNGRIRVFAEAARGQLNQNRLNLIRFFLNHTPLKRTDCEERKGFSPYQLLLDKKEDTRHWFDILWQDYLKDKLPRIKN